MYDSNVRSDTLELYTNLGISAGHRCGNLICGNGNVFAILKDAVTLNTVFTMLFNVCVKIFGKCRTKCIKSTVGLENLTVEVEMIGIREAITNVVNIHNGRAVGKYNSFETIPRREALAVEVTVKMSLGGYLGFCKT